MFEQEMELDEKSLEKIQQFLLRFREGDGGASHASLVSPEDPSPLRQAEGEGGAHQRKPSFDA